ncbi:hypothetical protein [Sodalis glossinidius]|nr:hypothetical protein [Sodalis glossinidius]
MKVLRGNENLVDLFCSPEIDEYLTIIHLIFHVNENDDGYEVEEDEMYFLLRGTTRRFWEIDLCSLMNLEFGRERLMEDVGLFPFLKQEFKNYGMLLYINSVHKKILVWMFLKIANVVVYGCIKRLRKLTFGY